MAESKSSIVLDILREITPAIEAALERIEVGLDRSSFTKTVYTTNDIKERYGVNTTAAQKIIREAKHLSNGAGGKLGKGRLVWSELAVWEAKIGR